MPDDEIHSALKTQSPHQEALGEVEIFAGVVRLRGELADRADAFLFVSIMPAGLNRPVGSEKIALSNPDLGTSGDGERAIPFRLEQVSVVSGDVELQVWFDRDGYVDTKEEGSLIRRFHVAHGATDIDVMLDPAAQ